jgi:hypothetical protein
VQFRRDALGSAHQLPISPTISSINGAEVCIHGTILKVDRKGLTLKVTLSENSIREYWIPDSSILLIEMK